MKKNSRVLEKLRSGISASCFKINLSDGQAAEIAALSGFDCLWIDQEHLAQNWSVINSQIWAAKSQGIDTMVRVPRGSYSDYIKPLEMDATGILVPHIKNLSDAKQVVEMTRFFPIGKRALDGGSADAEYTNMALHDYMLFSNQQKFIALQIEDPEVLPDLDAIAALPGVDMLFFGPGDFSQGIGAPGEWDHPLLLDARRMVAEAARRHGKFAATSAGIDSLSSLLKIGYTFVNVGADVIGLNSYCKNLTTQFNEFLIDPNHVSDPGKPY